MKYIDTHSHPHFPQYDADRDEMLVRMRAALVGTIAVGTSVETSRGAVELAQAHPDVWAAIGVHPNDIHEKFDPDVFTQMLDKRVVAVGECGLDFFRSDREADGARQRENFERQIAWAAEHDLPLMLHVRASKDSTDAHDEALTMLRSAQAAHGNRVRGTAHFFTGPAEIGRQYWELGFMTSIPGVVTFAPDMHQLIRAAPLGMLLSETDAPYAAPVPHRRERNEPAFVTEVVHTIADIRGEDREAVRTALLANAERLFGLECITSDTYCTPS